MPKDFHPRRPGDRGEALGHCPVGNVPARQAELLDTAHGHGGIGRLVFAHESQIHGRPGPAGRADAHSRAAEKVAVLGAVMDLARLMVEVKINP